MTFVQTIGVPSTYSECVITVPGTYHGCVMSLGALTAALCCLRRILRVSNEKISPHILRPSLPGDWLRVGKSGQWAQFSNVKDGQGLAS